MSAADGHSRNNMWRESVSAGRGVCSRDAEGDKGCWFGFERVTVAQSVIEGRGIA